MSNSRLFTMDPMTGWATVNCRECPLCENPLKFSVHTYGEMCDVICQECHFAVPSLGGVGAYGYGLDEEDATLRAIDDTIALIKTSQEYISKMEKKSLQDLIPGAPIRQRSKSL